MPLTSSYYWGGSSRKVHWTENMDHGNFQFRPRFHPFDHRDVYDEPSGVLSLDRLNLGSQKGHSQKCSIYFVQIRNKSWVTLAGKLQIYLVRVSFVGHRAGGSRESRYIMRTVYSSVLRTHHLLYGTIDMGQDDVNLIYIFIFCLNVIYTNLLPSVSYILTVIINNRKTSYRNAVNNIIRTAFRWPLHRYDWRRHRYSRRKKKSPFTLVGTHNL